MPTGGHHEHSDLARGRFATPVVEKLFTASRYLLAVKPWTFVKAHQVLRMDIPTLGIDGTCLSIIGQLGENRRVLIFPSFDGFERFLAAANAGRREHGAITMGTELLSLTFQHAAESPPSMYCEAMGNASSRRTSEQAPTQRASSGSRGAFPISRSRAHTHRRHGHPLQTVPSAGLIERPQEQNRVDALR